MDKIILKKEKPLRVWAIGSMLIITGLLGWGKWDQVIILVTLGLLIFGYTKSYKITSDYKNFTIYSFFSIPILKRKLDILFPEYISIFSSNGKRMNEYGPVSALGSISKERSFMIRFFNSNKHFTIFRSKNKEALIDKAESISKMLNVKLIDKTKS